MSFEGEPEDERAILFVGPWIFVNTQRPGTYCINKTDKDIK